MSDDAFHEIQLNGKQLVFLFMAGTVVCVVIFLCGVMVGRGVRAPRVAAAEIASQSPVDPTAPAQKLSTPSTPASDNAPVSTQETLTYPDRLEAPTPPAETVRKAEPVASFPEPSKRVPVAKAPAAASASAASAEPSGNGYVVQVAAVRGRSEADTIARRLSSKGYPSFVTTPGTGGPDVYRVRVGKYNDRREAESIARRLEKEEQFKPWITR